MRCYSSRNLAYWKDEGIVLPVVKDERESSVLEEACVIERPKVVYNERTRKYAIRIQSSRNSMNNRRREGNFAENFEQLCLIRIR
ncbi:MAG: hypothetical protein LBJ47_11240 [Tannerella sp.]|nr:hypothetical protein [Tannerella sp.]